MSPFRSSFFALSSILALSSAARAEPTAEVMPVSAESQTTTSPAASRVALTLDVDDASVIDREAFRAALESSLHAPVDLREVSPSEPQARHLVVQLRNGHLAVVTYTDGKGERVSRAIEVTGDTSALSQAAILLAENLAHDQTSQLLKPGASAATPTAPVASAPATPQVEPTSDDGPLVPVIVSLFYPIATNWTQPRARTPFALDLVFGRNGGIRGAQVSGAAGWSSGRVDGAQIAGAASIAKEVRGAQISGAVNVAGDLAGAQIAGGTNVGGDVAGAQISVVNIGRNVDGAQIGVVNVGKKVRGLQLGVLNVADSVDGASYGLASLIKDGHIRGLAWASLAGHTLYGNAGVEWASKYAYAIVQGAYTKDHLGPGVRFGARAPIGRLSIGGDVGTSTLLLANGNSPGAGPGGGSGGSFFGRGYFPDGSSEDWLDTDTYSNHEARALVRFDVTKNLALFAGGGISVAVSNHDSTLLRIAQTYAAGISIGN